jgi:hypothetical protein
MLPIYKRVRDEGRMIPDGLKYVDSWVEPNFSRCFQLMESDDLRLLQEWCVRHCGTPGVARSRELSRRVCRSRCFWRLGSLLLYLSLG